MKSIGMGASVLVAGCGIFYGYAFIAGKLCNLINGSDYVSDTQVLTICLLPAVVGISLLIGKAVERQSFQRQ